jgi:zinc transport system substrate-binding protein
MRYIISLVLASLALPTSLAVPSWAEVPKVMTDIPPVHALVAQVMGDLGTPDLLLERGASEHDFQLRPSQAAALADAGLVVWIGPELTPWLDRALEGLGEGGAQLPLLAVPGTLTLAYAAGGAHMAEEGHDDHGHDDHGHEDAGHEEAGHDEAGHDDHGHDEGHDHAGTDPHAWLNPENAKVWLGAIAAELGRIDPDNAATYAANATTAVAGIDQLDADLTQRFAALKDRPVVVFHDAYGYLADRYGLSIFGSIALGDATAPGAARLTELRDATAGGAVLCVFPEAQHDPKLAEQLAEGSGARLGPALDPNGSTLEPGPGLYAALLTGLATAMTSCTAP